MTKQELVIDLIIKHKKNLFLTGKAGTGKTYLLKKIIEILNKERVNYEVCAPTGIAAINAEGVTLHSYFRLPFEVYDYNQKYSITINPSKAKELRLLELLIIDEISMVRMDYLIYIDKFMKSIKKSDLPFGGTQLLFIGDLFQLPPVLTNSEFVNFSRLYPNKSPFFFEIIPTLGLEMYMVELDVVHRQKDIKFKNILNNIREGNPTDTDVSELNTRYGIKWDDSYTILTPLKDRPPKGANCINSSELDKLPDKESIYTAEITGDFKESEYPTDVNLRLKVGARVMLCRNGSDADDEPYYNGLLGKVTALKKNVINIKCDDGRILRIQRETWEKKKYDNHGEMRTSSVIGTFKQFPLKLAWAITIHKSQGLTLDKVVLNPRSFAGGQTYVGLSRCTSLEGLILANPIRKEDVWIDENLTKYKNYFRIIESEEDLHKYCLI